MQEQFNFILNATALTGLALLAVAWTLVLPVIGAMHLAELYAGL